MFIEHPACRKSISGRKPIYGIGINDSEYITNPSVDGKQIMCPVYSRWHELLKRCYSSRYQNGQPTYIGCSACNEWLYFSGFKSWMEKQEWDGKELDKDLIDPGNKVYSPDKCIFIPKSLNNLLNDHANLRGTYPQGVNYHKSTGRFAASCSVNGRRQHIGLYDDPNQAYIMYREFKSNHVREIAQTQEPRLKAALIRHANLILNS